MVNKKYQHILKLYSKKKYRLRVIQNTYENDNDNNLNL